MAKGKGKRGGFKAWPVTLTISIVSFFVFVMSWASFTSQLHMDSLLDFFVMIAEIGIWAQFAGITLLVAILFGIVTIPLAILRR